MQLETMIDILLQEHFTTLVLVVAYAIKLYEQKQTKDIELRYFWMPLVSCFLLVIEDVCENVASLNPSLYYMRIFLSVIGYFFRPFAAVGLLLVVTPPEKRNWTIFIPCYINGIIFLTAFFSPIAFSYDENYHFQRGPLGYTVFIVGFFYMLQVLVVTWKRFYKRDVTERTILIICALSCIAATFIDATYDTSHLPECIMVSSVFFYIFLRSYDNRSDPLTSLQNRFAFYNDLLRNEKSITAIASLDMNGLKTLNDTQGHAAGDKALKEIGNCLLEISDRNIISYRIGGDEFVILFLQQNEKTVQNKLRLAKDNVVKSGYSISVGYAMRSGNSTMDDVLQKSDHNMYKDKEDYYAHNKINQRMT